MALPGLLTRWRKSANLPEEAFPSFVAINE
jgi:hypothetical protein